MKFNLNNRFNHKKKIDEIKLLTSHPTDDGYLEAAREVIVKSNLFDSDYYLETNPDVKQSGMDPIAHYILHGGSEGRNPSREFNAQYYLAHNADIRESGMNPLLHYIILGVNKTVLINEQPSVNDREYRQYLSHQRFIKNRINNYDITHQKTFKKKLEPILEELTRDNRALLVYPLSYPLDVAQRPEHFFRYMAEKDIPTLILDFDDSSKSYVRELRKNVYVTNLMRDSVSFLKTKNTILYITYPLYSVMISLLNPQKIIYDALDELSCFSGSLKGLERDHERLLADSDVVMFSSQRLMESSGVNIGDKYFLVENGVWVKDFSELQQPAIKYPDIDKNTKIIGYYGAVSNLLDWPMIDEITKNPTIHMIFIGPIADFENGSGKYKSLRTTILDKHNVTHIDTVKYKELPRYAASFDAGIVPFEVNDITDSVSPLKLYEYMAAGLKIFATPTKTIQAYENFISITDAKLMPSLIADWSVKDSTRADYEELLKSMDWGSKFSEPVKFLKKNKAKATKTPVKQIDIININFYDYEGKVVYKGGAERYVYDLACLIKKMGHYPRILQNSAKAFRKTYNGIDIIGVPTGVRYAAGKEMRKISRVFNDYCKDTDLIIASPIDLACEIKDTPVIGINHGIHWDNIRKSLHNNKTSDYSEIFDALDNVEIGICVDTNFINWTRTYDYSFGEKLKYVPNYFDKDYFQSTPKNFTKKLKIMYPRRLYDARGIYITLEAFDYLLNVHSEIDLLLVGQTDDSNVKNSVESLMKKYPNRVTLEEYDMEDMYKAYKESNVVLIPTRYSEGTSLSCIEAMATNNAVISTNIGGLPNLIIDGYNGLLIDPSVKSLIEAVETLYNDRELTERLSSKALDMVGVFDKVKWDIRWSKLIKEIL